MSALTIGPVTLDYIGVPMRTPINRSRRRMTRVEGAYNLDGILTDFGKAEGFLHVFQSQQNVGHLTTAQVRQLEALEEAGNSLTLTTDLFGEDGQLETFTAYFDTEAKPLYSPAVPSGKWWLFQIPLYLVP